MYLDEPQTSKRSKNKKTPEQRMLEAVMGFAGGVGWQDEDNTQTVYNTEPLDDPFTELSIKAIAKRIKAKMDNVLWENEDLKPEEIPEHKLVRSLYR